jgi:mannose-6-phosphate isomerase-like protein (cupin superfamily)
MIKIIETPTLIKAAGNVPKQIEEFFGRVTSATQEVSIARMKSPAGWEEPGQCPDFNEYSVVLRGTLKVKTRQKEIDLKEGQAILVGKGEWVKYSTPYEGGAEYIAVCLPAFSPESVNRDV